MGRSVGGGENKNGGSDGDNEKEKRKLIKEGM